MNLLVGLGDKIIPEGYRDATDSEIMAAAAKIVDKRMGGEMSPFVSTALHELATAFGWCDENGYPEAIIHVQFDGHWQVAMTLPPVVSDPKRNQHGRL